MCNLRKLRGMSTLLMSGEQYGRARYGPNVSKSGSSVRRARLRLSNRDAPHILRSVRNLRTTCLVRTLRAVRSVREFERRLVNAVDGGVDGQ